MVENGSKFEKGKFSLLKKLSKNPQKILGYRSRRVDSKNIACLWSRNKIFEIFAFQVKFLKNSKNAIIQWAIPEKRLQLSKKRGRK